MAKLTLTDLSSLANETSVVTAINNNNAAIEAALEETLSRDGTSPNEMEATLDMNNNRIINLPDAVDSHEPVTKHQLDSVTLAAEAPVDHGTLLGLTDDDHPQYHNNARGDARYALLSHTHAQSDITGLVAALAALQPLDSDLTAIAALTTTSYGRAFLALADAAAGRTALGLGTMALETASNYLTTASAASSYQPLDSDLTALAALTTTAYGRALLALADAAAARTALGLGTMATETASNYLTTANAASTYQPLDTDLTSIAALSTTAFGRGLLTETNASTARTTLGVVIGTNVQAYDAELAAIAGLTSAADRAPYFTGSGTAALATLTSFGRSLMDDADAAAGRATLSVTETLTANRTYYVRTDGSDSNTGLANTSGGAFLTVQKAIDVAGSLIIGSYDVTIQIADGTYTGNIIISAPWQGTGNVYLLGNTTTPANVILTSNNGAVATLNTRAGSRIVVDGVSIACASSFAVKAETSSYMLFRSACRFGTAGSYQIWATTNANIELSQSYEVYGNASFHIVCTNGGFLVSNGTTITFTNSPVFSHYLYIEAAGVQYYGNSWTNKGTVTCAEYYVTLNGTLFANGYVAGYYPGTAGTNIAGGQVV